MDNQKYNGIDASFDRGNKKIKVTLGLLNWTEDNIYFYYSPALDLTGYGKTESEAMDSFTTVLEEFVEYTDNKKTIYSELEKLGWTTNKKKKRALPPTDEQLLEDNEIYKELASRSNVGHTQKQVVLA